MSDPVQSLPGPRDRNRQGGFSAPGPDSRVPPPVRGIHFDTSNIPASDREEVTYDVISKGQTPVELTDLGNDPDGVSMQIDATELGPISVQNMRISAVQATRGPRLARQDSDPCLFLISKKVGTSTLIQQGREAVFGPGDLILLSSSDASMVTSAEQDERHVLRIPTEHLAVSDRLMRRSLAIPLRRNVPLAGVLARFVDDLIILPDSMQPSADHLARATVDLVRGLIATVTGDERQAEQAREADIQLHVADYLDRHWREHDLTAERMAAAHHISTRQLYRILTAQGISLGDWLRQRRLEACRDELANPGASSLSVASVGRRWGFNNATNFGRAFKTAFGLTPMQWRKLHQPSSNGRQHF